jgi:hypothetical protein
LKNNIKKKLVRKRSRLGVSEVMGSVLLMGVTLAVGFAVWAWASNAAIASEKSFGNAVGTNAGCLNLGIVIVNANFSSTNANLVTLWFYNNGRGAVNITNIQITNSNSTIVDTYSLVQSRTNLTGQVSFEKVKSLTINTLSSAYNTTPITFDKSAIYSFQTEVHNETLTKVSSTSSYYSYQCGLVSAQYQQVTPSII